MEEASPPPCPGTVTVRRNPHRRGRPTPTISNFPIEDIVAMVAQQNPPPKPSKPPIDSNSYSLKVFLRLRPLPITPPSKAISKSLKSKQPKTTKRQSKICLTINDPNSITIWPPCDSSRSKSEIYNGFTHIFSPDSSQDDVYEKLMRPIVEEFINGKSGLLAALGPTGSGKTHTVFGSAKDPGLVPRALHHIFEQNMGNQSKLSRSYYLSMFEICSERGKGEKLSDLSPDGADIYMQQCVVKGLKEALVRDAKQAEFLIHHAMAKRATAMTNSNSQSSRSQCIINIRCAFGEIIGDDESCVSGAVLTFVDLAGAERQKKTANQGGRLLESNFINNTSMVFGLCLRSLLEHQKNPKKPLQRHFQSSMLTRYLRDYLEGRKRMALILTVRSGEEDYFDASFLLRQASPYMEIKFHNMEKIPNLAGNKRNSQTIRTKQQKRVKLSDANACKDYVRKTCQDSNEFCKEGLPGEFQKDQAPRENANTVPKNNCIDAKTERELHVMCGFAKAFWNVLKQYKERVKTAENDIDVLTENLRIGHGRYLVMEKELCALKAQCTCQCNNSMSIPVQSHDSDIENGLIAFRSSSLGRAGLQESRSNDVSQVHLGDFPTSTKISVSESNKSGGILRKLFPEASAQQSYQVQHSPVVCEVQHSPMECEISCEHVSRVDLHEILANKDNRKSSDAAFVSQPYATDLMVLGESSGCITHGRDEKENVCVGTGSNLCHELEAKKICNSRPLNAEVSKRLAENPDSEEESGFIGSRSTPISFRVLQGSTSLAVTKVHHGDLPTCTKNSELYDESDESDAILRKKFQDAKLPSLDCEASAEQIHQAALIGCGISNGQFSRDGCHEKHMLKKKNKEPSGVAACSPKLDDDRAAQGESSECNNHGKEDKENVAIGPESKFRPELETTQTSNCKPLNQRRPKRRLMPASSLLLRDVSSVDTADESETARKGKGGQRFVEAESKRSRGHASLFRLLKTHLPR